MPRRPSNTLLLQALRRSNVEKHKKLLRNTPLMQAMRRNDVAEFRSILERDGWPRDRWSDYELLVAAITLCHRKIVDVLLEKGCRIARDGCHAKTFHDVVKNDWVDVAEKFLDRGARVYDQDSIEQNTALHVAFLYGGSEAMIELLLSRFFKETSLNIENFMGLSVWHVICARARCEFVKKALDRGFADINSKVLLMSEAYPNFAGYTAMHFAAKLNRLEVAKHLLDRNVNLYARDASGSTPLHVACKYRNVEMIDLIFSYDKINDNVVNDYDLSHFMAACAGTDVSIVKDFLKTADSQSWTCPANLVNSRVNDNYYPFGGYTPLHWAAEFGRYEVIKLLLSYEPPCCPIAVSKLTPAALASEGKHYTVFCELLKYCICYTKNRPHSKAGRHNWCQPDQAALKSNFEGYKVPNAWFSQHARPREYPHNVIIDNHSEKHVIPIYGPNPGTKYDIIAKLFSDKPHVRYYYAL